MREGRGPAYHGRKHESQEHEIAPRPDGAAFFGGGGGGGDIARGSRYAIFLGVPTALWGAVLYATIGGLGGLGFTVRRWLSAFLLAAAGVGVSIYLTVLALFILGGAC